MDGKVTFDYKELLPQIEPFFDLFNGNATGEGISSLFIAVLFLIFLVFLGWVIWAGFRSRQSVTFFRELFRGLTPNSLIDKRQDLKQRAKEGDKRLGELWAEFDETLVVSEGEKRIQNTYDAAHFFNAHTLAEENGAGYFLTGLQRLRDVSLHPDLLGGMELPLPATVQECKTEARKSGKLSALLNVLDEIKDRQEKVLIFVINKRLQIFLSHILGKIYAMPVAVLNGDTKAVAKRQSVLTRRRLIEQFEAREGSGMMIMSPVAAGVGLTITGANNVIHLERHWNPAKEDQATDRVYRIGQIRDVSVFIPILHHPGHDSFDLHLHRLLAKKIDLKDAVVAPESVTHESFQQDILGRITDQGTPPPLSEQDLDLIGWEQFEALVAELLCRAFDGDAQLTPVSNDKGCDVVLVSTHGNLLAQCKYTKQGVLQGRSFIGEIVASQKFYADRLAKDFGQLAVFTNAKKIGKQGQQDAKLCHIKLYDRFWILENLRQYSITKFDLLRRIDKPRLTW